MHTMTQPWISEGLLITPTVGPADAGDADLLGEGPPFEDPWTGNFNLTKFNIVFNVHRLKITSNCLKLVLQCLLPWSLISGNEVHGVLSYFLHVIYFVWIKSLFWVLLKWLRKFSFSWKVWGGKVDILKNHEKFQTGSLLERNLGISWII